MKVHLRVGVTVLFSMCLAHGVAEATEYHVAAGQCTHGASVGVDTNDGRSRGTAFLTVQTCLNRLQDGDTCTIHTGTYTGNFNCCGHGDSTIEEAMGTAAAPTRIMGATGDNAVLKGTSAQIHPEGELNAYSTNIGTLTLRAESYGQYSRYVEVGNLTINPGKGPAIAGARLHNFYIHDIKVTDLSLYVPPSESVDGETYPKEDTGIIWLWVPSDGLLENIEIGNGGVVRLGHAFNLAQGDSIKMRNVKASDFQGALNQGHKTNDYTYEFVKLRNWIPNYYDDAGLVHLYNNTATTLRYVSVAQKPDPGRPTYYLAGARRSEGATPCNNGSGPNSAYFVNLTLQGDGPDEDAAIGASEFQHEGFLRCVNDWRAYNNLFKNFRNGIHFRRDAGGLTDSCAMTTFAHNAYGSISETRVLADENDGTCGYISRAEPGRVTCGGFSCTDVQLKLTDHVPAVASPLSNGGSTTTFGTTPWLPAPDCGVNAKSDIGAFESECESLGIRWPYDFKVIATVTKDPAVEAVKICWDTAEAGCDVMIPVWDPGSRHAHNGPFARSSARPSEPDWYHVQVDPDANFMSGRTGVRQGFGAFYDSAAQGPTSRRYHLIPAGRLQEGASYYVQLRVAETPDYWKNSPDANNSYGNGGWGPWSVGFYRFTVVGGDPPVPDNPPGNVENLRRTDK